MQPATGGTSYTELVDELAHDVGTGAATALLNDELSEFGVPNPRLLIIGCGGSGNNTMNRITHLGVEGAVTVAINTDKQHLDHTRAMQKLLVGRHITRGLGAGGDPGMGRRCAEAGRDVISRIVSHADLVFVTAGLGGGTGTGIAPVVAEEALEQPAEGVARLAPEVGFKAVFTARDRLEIRPDAPLERGRELTLTLFPQELSGVDDGLPPLKLPLTVLRQQLSLRVDALAPVDEAPARMRLDGELTTADQADPLAVQSAVTATQADRRLEIEWHHGAAGLSHGFRIGGIRRDGEPAPVVLRWDGEPLAVEESGEREYPVPAEGAFQVTAARTLSYPQPHIRVQFSQPLMGSQDTAGLVQVNGEEARVRIDGSRLLVYPGGEAGDDGSVPLPVGAGLRSASRARLDREFSEDLVLRVAKPSVRFVGDGVILPAGETRGLRAGGRDIASHDEVEL